MPFIKQHCKPTTPKDLLTFPWEVETEQERREKAAEFRITKEQEAELNEIIKVLEKKQ